jgi:hypothetical protein
MTEQLKIGNIISLHSERNRIIWVKILIDGENEFNISCYLLGKDLALIQ